MVNFVNVFLSYVVQLLVIGVAAAVALTIGITMAKKKNAKAAPGTESAENADRV